MYLLCPYVVQKRLNVSNSVIPILPLAYRAGGGRFAMTYEFLEVSKILFIGGFINLLK
jgi:hypothetical protein